MPADGGLDTGGISLANFDAARKRAAAIVAKMTLAEKITQFGTRTPAIPRIGLPGFNFYGSEGLHGLIHGGPITSFPLPLAMGCSWNRELIKQVFTAVSDEVWAWHKVNGQSLALFSPPTVNMGTRDPRWGRIGENYSEDPYLVGEMATYTIHGMQGDDPKYLKTIACAKHYICNDTDSDRVTTSASVDSRSFWEYYTRGFHACVTKGKVFTVMSSYNSLNGVPTTASRFLLTDVLRRRWGFKGYVVSDCDAVGCIYQTHHFVPTGYEAAALAVNAGCDINCGDTLQKYLGKAVDKMLISEPVIDRSLTRSITGRILLGEFDPPEQIPYSKIQIDCRESKSHRALAREAGRQSIVLFKNENNLLPLGKTKLKKIAVIGPMASVCHLGNYSGSPQHRVSPLQGIFDIFGIESQPSYSKMAASFASMGGNPQVEGGGDLGFIKSGSWTSYDNVLFSGATELHARVASRGAGGSIEVHLDRLDGPAVCKLAVPVTGDWQKWVDVSAPITGISGEHKVFLRFSGKAGAYLFNLRSFSLTPVGPILATAAKGVEVSVALGCSVDGTAQQSDIDAAAKLASEADVAFVFVGVDQAIGAEGHDRSHIGLPGAQHELIKAVFAANPKTVLVISSNAPVAINWEQENVPAIVGGMFAGQEQGHAIADVLFGDYNPAGKLTTTWYASVDDLPHFHDYDVRKGRTYLYYRGKPLYPFGHGLSYTTFEYANIELTASDLKPRQAVGIALTVTNTGRVAGDEIVQFYVHVNGSKVQRPIKQLVDFARIHLEPGETKTVSFALGHDEQALKYWDEAQQDFVQEPGKIDILVGASSADIRLKEAVNLVV
ncbi:MAG: glycoside hydrolase family 3 C-terminal domain-containing protein [Phycisphaerae bacterium]